jgi:hypothetical protein
LETHEHGRPLRPRLDQTSGPSARYGHSTMLTPGSSPERVGTRMLTGILEVLNLAAWMWTIGTSRNQDDKRTQPLQQLHFGVASDGEILGHSVAISDRPLTPKTLV